MVKIWYKEYWVNDQKHRSTEDGPAIITYDENGKIRSEEYWVNGEICRPPTPPPLIKGGTC